MNKQTEPAGSGWTDEFENFYILTYQALYRHSKLIFSQEEKVKELLILTYMEAYRRWNQIQKEKTPSEWLIRRADVLAETKMGASKEQLEASHAEEKMQSKEAKKDRHSGLDETSVLLEVEDRLGLVDEPEKPKAKSIPLMTAQGIFSCLLLVLAVLALAVGVLKVKNQLEQLRTPFEKTFADAPAAAETAVAENSIQVGDKAVVLSGSGKVLYSLPLEESRFAGAEGRNPEIQHYDGWTYYLPCPDREDSRLSQVSPKFSHTLYRMKDIGDDLEIIAREVDNYTFWKDGIYVSQYGRIQRIGTDDRFETEKAGLYAAEENGEIYLYDLLGRPIKTEEDGSIRYGDRIFQMSDNRIQDVHPGERIHGDAVYSLKEKERGQNAIFRSINGAEELFEERGNTIDSFCIAGDWLYYSAYIRRGGSGAHYSELYRKSLTGDKEAELLREEYTGRMRRMYYSQDTEQIYAEYIPKNWKSNHGVIAVISQSGQMSYLNDEELRAAQKTTGNDILQFVLVQDGQVYCYWEDCHWKKGEDPVALWRKVLIIPDRDRVMAED